MRLAIEWRAGSELAARRWADLPRFLYPGESVELELELAPGDSVYYLSTTPHLIAAKSGQATIVAVLYGQ